jgi:flagellar FliL protein
MAENDDDAGDSREITASGKGGKLKFIIIIVSALAVLGGGAVTWFMFFGHSGGGEEKHAEEKVTTKPPAFVEVPDMLVNLVTGPGERVQYLKVKLTLEVKEEKQVEAIKPSLPRVTDIFQTYLRELRPSDIAGSAGLFRLKEELTRRVNAAVAPSQVSAVLFKEIVVQ